MNRWPVRGILLGLCVFGLTACPGPKKDPSPVNKPDNPPKQASDNPKTRPNARPVRVLSENMVTVEAGTFTLGSPDFDDEVSGADIMIAKFRIDRTEVSNAQYAAFLEDISASKDYQDPPEVLAHYPGGKDHTPNHWGTEEYKKYSPTDKHPVVWIDWYDALAYARWAGKRLPTECEWEKAAGWDAKREVKRLYPWGDRGPGAKNDFVANYKPILGSGLDGFVTTAPVTAFERGQSSYGLVNMGGNVAEWCADWYFPSYKNHKDIDPQGPKKGLDKVLRGGSFDSGESDLRSTARLFVSPETRQPFIGFRCAK